MCYAARVDMAARWEVECTDEFVGWYDGLADADVRRVNRAVEMLERHGPALTRPLVDTVKGSRHANMKELRPPGEQLRIFFAFDPRRTAILLIGGNKRHRWVEFYAEMIPVADDLYDVHLATLRREQEGREA